MTTPAGNASKTVTFATNLTALSVLKDLTLISPQINANNVRQNSAQNVKMINVKCAILAKFSRIMSVKHVTYQIVKSAQGLIIRQWSATSAINVMRFRTTNAFKHKISTFRTILWSASCKARITAMMDFTWRINIATHVARVVRHVEIMRLTACRVSHHLY